MMDLLRSLLPFAAREPTLLEKAWITLRYPLDLFYHPFETILSLPALSFLIIPAFSSYGTTLNFLFFYMTWTILIRSNPPLQVEFLGALTIRVFFYVTPSVGFLLFDSGVPGLAANIKEHGETALPMGDEQGGTRGRWWKISLVSLGNVFLSVLLQTAIEFLFTRVLHIRSALKVTTSLPMPWSIVKDVLLALLLRELLTYTLHRYILHAPRSPIAKRHASWQHSIVSPFSLVAHYDHPLPYLVHVFLPMYIPAVFLHLHLLSFFLYLTVVSLEETFTYSGYNVLPSGLILGGIARRQERHLMGYGEGNFGCFGLSDYVMGTSMGEDLLDDVADEADKKNRGKKGKRGMNAMKDKLRKKKSRSYDEEEEDEEDQYDEEVEEAEEEEPRPRRTSGRRRGKKSSEEEDDEEEQRSRRQPRLNGRKKSSDESNDKTKRKASGARRKSKALLS